MQWSELQPFLQLMAGLNIALYTFKEVRAPLLTEIRKDVRCLSAMIETALSNIAKVRQVSGMTNYRRSSDDELESNLLAALLKLNRFEADLAGLETAEWRVFERTLSRSALVVAAGSIILLLVASFTAFSAVPWAGALLIGLVGITPATVLICANYALFRKSRSIFYKADGLAEHATTQLSYIAPCIRTAPERLDQPVGALRFS